VYALVSVSRRNPRAGTAPTGGNVVIDFTYPVSMRAAPTVAFSTIVYGNMSGLSLATAQPDHARIIAVVGTGPAFGTATSTVTLSAEI
jgi:hypothetical protein